MKVFLFLSTVLFSFQLFSQQSNETMIIGTENRSFIQYLPTGFHATTESLPVVFVLHGLGDNALNMTNMGFNDIADTARFIVIYPEGLQNSFGQNSWNNGILLGASVADDLGLMNALIDHLINSYNADHSRIYVTGFSMGGIMSYHLACELNNRVAAIACMSGRMSESDIATCAPTFKTPVMHVHGTADGVVTIGSGPFGNVSVPQTLEFWRNVLTCAQSPDSTQIPDTAPDGFTVDKFVWTNCVPDESLEFWRVNGAGHIFFQEPTNDFTESHEVWRFFRKWSHPNAGTSSLTENIQSSISVFPNPTEGFITISAASVVEISISDMNGKLYLTDEVSAGETILDVSHLKNGVYLIRSSNGYIERLVMSNP